MEEKDNKEDKINAIEFKCMMLASEWYQLRDGVWPYGPEKPEEKQFQKLKKEQMKEIVKQIKFETGIDAWIILSYYWNCIYNKDMEIEEWVRWMLFEEIPKRIII